MPRPTFHQPDTSNSTGHYEGQQHRDASYTTNVLHQILQQMDSLRFEIHHLQSAVDALHRPQRVDISTQTTDPDLSSLDFEHLTSFVSESQQDDRSISMLKFFIERDIQPARNEIYKFEPALRRCLWQFQRFHLRDNVLYRKRKDNDRVSETFQLFVPNSIVPDVIHAIHSKEHENTFQEISKHFFWPFMHRDVDNYSKTCSSCQLRSRVCNGKDMSPSHAVEKAVLAISNITKDLLKSSGQQISHAKPQKKHVYSHSCRSTPDFEKHQKSPDSRNHQKSSDTPNHHKPAESSQSHRQSSKLRDCQSSDTFNHQSSDSRNAYSSDQNHDSLDLQDIKPCDSSDHELSSLRDQPASLQSQHSSSSRDIRAPVQRNDYLTNSPDHHASNPRDHKYRSEDFNHHARKSSRDHGYEHSISPPRSTYFVHSRDRTRYSPPREHHSYVDSRERYYSPSRRDHWSTYHPDYHHHHNYEDDNEYYHERRS